MNQQQKTTIINKLKAAKDAEVLFTSDYDKTSVKRCLTELTKMLRENPEATIIILR
jgi:xanthine dehydrogenase iron-sulfur cluster and FAD-binding subunit A